MTLNAVIALILRFSPNLTDFQAGYITVMKIGLYNVRKILSPSSSLLLFGENYNTPCSAVSLR